MGKHHSKFGYNDAAKTSNGLPGMICFPTQLRRANSVDSFVVPLLPTAQSVMSVASTNGRSLSLESIPLVDTAPLLRTTDQPNDLASNCLTHSSKNIEPSDTNVSSSTESCCVSEPERKESELERKESELTIQGSFPGSQDDSPFFNLSEQEWKEVVDFVCSRVHCTLRKALLDYRTHHKENLSAAKLTTVERSRENDRDRGVTQKRKPHRKLQMNERDVKQFDELLQQRLQQMSVSCFQDGRDNSRREVRTRKRTTNHYSAPLTPHLPRRRELHLSARSKSEEDTSRCGKQSDDDFQTRLEEIAKQCDSRGIRGKGVAMTDSQNSQHKFTPKRHKKGPRRGHSKSLADIDNNAPGLNRINENRQKISKKSHSMGRDYAKKYPNGRPFVVRHKEPEIQPINDTLQVQQEVHYYHKHFEVQESSTAKMTSLQSTTTCERHFNHLPHSGAHHDCSCHPVHSGRVSPQTDMAVFNLDVDRLDHQRLVRHWHRHDHHHFHIVQFSNKRTQV